MKHIDIPEAFYPETSDVQWLTETAKTFGDASTSVQFDESIALSREAAWTLKTKMRCVAARLLKLERARRVAR